MMPKKEIDIFYDMACLYEYVGNDLTKSDEIIIDNIQKLYACDEFNSINILYNEGEYDTANEAFNYLFDIGIGELNKLADEFGFCRVGEA